MGANDNIMTGMFKSKKEQMSYIATGESTFMVELNETNLIMQYATPHSFAILDEFGRGTSTHDGCALAFAVLDYLLRIKLQEEFYRFY